MCDHYDPPEITINDYKTRLRAEIKWMMGDEDSVLNTYGAISFKNAALRDVLKLLGGGDE